MKKTNTETDVTKRNDQFAKKIKTKIWQEEASETNPYIAQKCRIHGYDLAELTGSISFCESIYLNIKGELPNNSTKGFMDAIFVALSNLGPRHPATRAVMNAAVSKTKASHLLPIGLSILSGEYSGADEVENSVRFIRKNINKPAQSVAHQLIEEVDGTQKNIAPGFGMHHGSIDILTANLADKLASFDAADRALQWGMTFAAEINKYGYGWMITGVAGACFVDLGFSPKASAGVFQLAAAPGLLAHGLEMLPKPLTAMPFIDDNDYHYIKNET